MRPTIRGDLPAHEPRLHPDGYRDVISNRGRDVDLHDVDGVHLNVAGAVIAAKLVVAALGEL